MTHREVHAVLNLCFLNTNFRFGFWLIFKIKCSFLKSAISSISVRMKPQSVDTCNLNNEIHLINLSWNAVSSQLNARNQYLHINFEKSVSQILLQFRFNFSNRCTLCKTLIKTWRSWFYILLNWYRTVESRNYVLNKVRNLQYHPPVNKSMTRAYWATWR